MKYWILFLIFCFLSSDCLLYSSNQSVPISFDENINNFLMRTLNANYQIERKMVSFANNNFLIKEIVSKNSWVLRIPSQTSNYLTNRTQELHLLNWAYRERLSPLQPKNYDLQNGYLLTPYLEGNSSAIKDFENPEVLESALKLLTKLHSSQSAPKTNKFHPLGRFFATSKAAKKNNLVLPSEVEDLVAELDRLFYQIPPNHFRTTLCHNDPSPENFFRFEGNLYLIDWELAGLNDPAWDLTHLCILGQIDHKKILEIYFTSDPLIVEKMTFFKPFILINTVIWASLERQQKHTLLDQETVEYLYQHFLQKIKELIKCDSFQDSFYKLKNGGIYER